MAYFFFLILWVLIFAFFYQSLGVGIGQNMTIIEYLGDSWEMSTKNDKGVIKLDYWKVEEDREDLKFYSWAMTKIV